MAYNGYKDSQRRSSTRAEVLRAMAASNTDMDDDYYSGAFTAGANGRKSSTVLREDINMSQRLDHLVRAEEEELQQLDIDDAEATQQRYAADVSTAQATGTAAPWAAPSPSSSPRASSSPTNRVSLSGSHSSHTALFSSAAGIRSFLKSPVTTPKLMQCRVVREKDQHITSDTFHSYMLYYEDGHHLLLTARRGKKGKRNPFIMSVDANDLTEKSSGCVAKIVTNFTGSEYTLVEQDDLMQRRMSKTGGLGTPSPSSKTRTKLHFGSSNDSDDEGDGMIGEHARENGLRNGSQPTGTAGVSPELGFITFRQNALKLTGGPRAMSYIIPNPEADSATTLSGASRRVSLADEFKYSRAVAGADASVDKSGATAILRTKTPMWCNKQGSYTLDFGGRVSTASVKNFQLIHGNPKTNADDLVLQFGKVGKDEFILDFRYPLNPLQAFAVAIGAMDGKLTVSI